MKKLRALMRINFFSQQNDTKIINFEESVLILWPFFWGNVIFKLCHFCLKVTIDVPKISIVGSPFGSCFENEDSMNKRSIHYVTLQCYNPGEATQRNSLDLKRDFLYKRSNFLKLTLLQKNVSRIKTPSLKLLISVSFCWKNNFLRINALTNLI